MIITTNRLHDICLIRITNFVINIVVYNKDFVQTHSKWITDVEFTKKNEKFILSYVSDKKIIDVLLTNNIVSIKNDVISLNSHVLLSILAFQDK